jgi:threonine dehydrogenase-like Zn-dependent dehydrogenase
LESFTMRAVAAFPKAKQVRVIETPSPRPVTGDQVLLRILEVGICGTDREIGAFHYGAPPAGSDHLILGHEALAEVVETGPEVTAVKKGDLVVPTVRRPCPHRQCAPCRAHRQDFCVTGDFAERGIKGAHGFLQEYVVEEDEYLVRVHRKLAEVAVLTEPLSISAKAAEQGGAIQQRLPWERPRVRGLVLGAGPVGLLGALSMVVHHADTFVYSLEPGTDVRAKIARDLGAAYVSGSEVPLGAFAQKIGAMDVIYEAVGISSVGFDALGALGPNGLLVFTGVPAPGKPRPVDTDTLMRDLVLKNQLVFGTVNASRSAYETALSELEQGMFLFPDGVRSLITHRHNMDEAPALITEPRGGIKQVVHLSDASKP